MEKELYRVLMDIGIHPDCIDAGELTEEIYRHMERGLQGEEGSMMMIPAYLFADGEIRMDEPVAVIDAGGTNLRAAKVVFTENGPEIPEIRRSRMPGTERSVTPDEMYDEFVRRILPLMPESVRVVLCFSYAFQSLPDGEARIITMGKEVAVEGCEGSLIRAGMEEAFRRAGYQGTPRITVLNDTAAVLYSALTAGSRNAVGFILGTGMNSAYFEKTENITKIPPVDRGSMAVNMESAYFSAVPSGIIDARIDSGSRNRGAALFEKMVSGAYLGEIASLSALELCERGLLSEKAGCFLREKGYIRAKDMADFLEKREGPCVEMCEGKDDAKTLDELFESVERRSGKLVACLVSAVVKRIRSNGGEGTTDIAVDGSTICLNSMILEEFTEWLDMLLGDPAAYRLIMQDDDTIIGSAAAAFLG